MKPLLFLLMVGCAFGQQGGTGITERQGKLITCPGDAGCPSVFAEPAPSKNAEHVAVAKCSPQQFYDHKCKPLPTKVEWHGGVLEYSFDGEVASKKPAKKDYLCTGACMTQIDKPEVEVEIKPSEAIDVPAIQETQPTNKKALSLCDVGFWLTSDSKGTPQCTRIYCKDGNRALMSSVNGKKHWCHRAQP